MGSGASRCAPPFWGDIDGLLTVIEGDTGDIGVVGDFGDTNEAILRRAKHGATTTRVASPAGSRPCFSFTAGETPRLAS